MGNAERQAAYKQKMKEKGFVQVPLWLHVEDKEHVVNMAKRLRGIREHEISHKEAQDED